MELIRAQERMFAHPDHAQLECDPDYAFGACASQIIDRVVFTCGLAPFIEVVKPAQTGQLNEQVRDDIEPWSGPTRAVSDDSGHERTLHSRTAKFNDSNAYK